MGRRNKERRIILLPQRAQRTTERKFGSWTFSTEVAAYY
jgi:hypothetical protein